MNFKWMSEENGELFRSLKGVVNNGGFFKSSGQAAFFEKRVKDQLPLTLAQCTCLGQLLLRLLKASMQSFARVWLGLVKSTMLTTGVSRARRKAWIFVIDEVGVVEMFIGRCKH